MPIVLSAGAVGDGGTPQTQRGRPTCFGAWRCADAAGKARPRGRPPAAARRRGGGGGGEEQKGRAGAGGMVRGGVGDEEVHRNPHAPGGEEGGGGDPGPGQEPLPQRVQDEDGGRDQETRSIAGPAVPHVE